MKTEDRVLRLENAFSTLIELARTQSERMDEYERRTEELAQGQKELTQAQKELTQTQKELAQAQKGLTQAQKGLTQAQKGLAVAQKQTEANLSALTNIVADIGRAQLRTEQALTKLSEKVDRYISGS